MIEITVREDGISIYGHANYAPRGIDIVCAGVSALMGELIDSLEQLAHEKIEYEISSGKADIYYKDLTEAARLLVESFFVGVRLIEDEHPKHVKTHWQAWNRNPGRDDKATECLGKGGKDKNERI